MNRGTSTMLSFTGQKEMLRKAANWMTGKSIITANSAWLAEVFLSCQPPANLSWQESGSALILIFLIKAAMIFEIFLHCHFDIQRGILEYNADILSDCPLFFGNIMPVDSDISLRFIQNRT